MKHRTHPPRTVVSLFTVHGSLSTAPRSQRPFLLRRGDSPCCEPTYPRVTPRVTCQNPQAKSPGFSNLPQSKRALQKPPRIEALATVPAQGGGG